MALASTAMNEIATAIEAVSVSKRGARDGLRRVRSSREITSGDRQFTVIPGGVPEHTEYIASEWRRFPVEVTVYYADDGSGKALDRAVEDGELIDTALWGLLNAASGTFTDLVVDGSSLDADEGVIAVTWSLMVTYDATVGE